MIRRRDERTSAPVAYVTVEADTLLRICFEQLRGRRNYKEALDLILRGTIPRGVIDDIEKSFVMIDHKGLGHRFSPQKRIFIDSWSELLNLGSLTWFYNAIRVLDTHWLAAVGIESVYRESSLREKFLEDGAIASRGLNGRYVVQSCMAQNIKGKSARGSLQKEVIARLQAKLANPPTEPEQILAATVVSETEGFGDLDFAQIAQETIVRYKGQTTYGFTTTFCVMLSFAEGGQVVVIPLAEFLPGGEGTVVRIGSELFM